MPQSKQTTWEKKKGLHLDGGETAKDLLQGTSTWGEAIIEKSLGDRAMVYLLRALDGEEFMSMLFINIEIVL